MGRGRSSFGGGSSRGSSSMGSSRGSSSTGRSSSVRIGGSRHVHHGWHHHGPVFHVNGSPWVGVIVGAMFAMIGLILIITGVSPLFDLMRYDKVSARCVDNDYANGWYYAVYDYNVDGDQYNNIRSNQGWEFGENVGAVVEIYYLKSDPKQIVEDPLDGVDCLWTTFGGVIFAGVGTLTFVLCLKAIKNKKNNDDDTPSMQRSSSSVGDQTESSYDRCPYCGSKYKRSSGSCPKCGAG